MPFRRNFNCCCRNHPRPVFCCANLSCTQNEVVNPVLQGSFGFFNNTATGLIENGKMLPLSFVQGQGFGISSTNGGAILLSAGSYEISYFAQGAVPSNGRLAVELQLNGVAVVGSQIFVEQTAGEVVTVSQTITMALTDNTILQLVNISGQAANFLLTSVFVRRL